MRALLATATLLAGCVTVGSGDIAEETRPLEAFSRIQTSGSVDVTFMTGPTPQATIVADDNLVPFVETAVVGDTLEVRTTHSYVSSHGISVRLVGPTLTAIGVSGSSDVRAMTIATDALTVSVSGSGSVLVGGVANALDAKISGSGDIDATAMPVTRAQLKVSGSGDAKVVARDELAASVSGSGSVRYGGEPATVSKDISGSGSVEPLL